MSTDSGADLLGPSQVRALADRLELRPTKQWGQNFVVDANTVRRIVRLAGVRADDHVLEVGPGLGSLTLGLLPVASSVTALEIDPVLAGALPQTVALRAEGVRGRLTVLNADALAVTRLPDPAPTVLVANLPYNVAVPVVLHLLARVPTLRAVLVMVQWEVAERLAAGPGSRTYGVPSAKAAWYAQVSLAGRVSRSVFWPAPHVDSGLVRMVPRPPPVTAATRQEVFAVVDAAFAQRRKTLRAALAGWAGGPTRAEARLRAAGIDPRSRGEQLGIEGFAALAQSPEPADPSPDEPPADGAEHGDFTNA
ncbi:MAG: 16S rRNA (adenine(1518)-N(6)/adenine(1519)-N(6))-dimethyltransferase RsmA [Ornithinimicrobium sp.]